MVLTTLALALLADIAPLPPNYPAPRKRPPPVQCVADPDCELSTFAGCCGGCCPQPPHAVPVGTRENQRCAAIDCERPNCEAVRCAGRDADVSQYVARCERGRCVAQPRDAECRQDTDCRVVEATSPACRPGPCGCCPVSLAVPADAAVPLQRRAPSPPPAPGSKPGQAPPYGLSTGDTAGPPRPTPNCSPCPAPRPGRAACLSGRCVLQLQPQPLPLPRPHPSPVG